MEASIHILAEHWSKPRGRHELGFSAVPEFSSEFLSATTWAQGLAPPATLRLLARENASEKYTGNARRQIKKTNRPRGLYMSIYGFSTLYADFCI